MPSPALAKRPVSRPEGLRSAWSASQARRRAQFLIASAAAAVFCEASSQSIARADDGHPRPGRLRAAPAPAVALAEAGRSQLHIRGLERRSAPADCASPASAAQSPALRIPAAPFRGRARRTPRSRGTNVASTSPALPSPARCRPPPSALALSDPIVSRIVFTGRARPRSQ